jgi:peptide deformylase
MVKPVPIIVAPNPGLRQVAKPIIAIDPKMLQILEELSATLPAASQPSGVGLAAPQISRLWRAFATYLEDIQTGEPVLRLFINPRIIDQSGKLTVGVNPRDPDLEGCLSIPGLYGPVSRPEWITLEYQTLQTDHTLSDQHTETFFDFPGRVIQHENDHLNGILFVDHIVAQGQPLFQAVNEDLVAVDPVLAKGF